jgi:hypothetical protein
MSHVHRFELVALAFSSLLLGCGREALSEPGTETGPCIEGECEGLLTCLSDRCVDPGSASAGTTGAEGGNEGDPPGDTGSMPPPIPVGKAVDILFLIDDSGSMAEEQVVLVSAIEQLVEALERPGVDADYRIAFTTSDNGNPLCPTNVKTPNGGTFVLSSCRQRATHFTFATVPPVEAFDPLCAQSCAHDVIEVVPTTTHQDPNPRPRPWIERIDGVSNLPPGISTAEAVRCFAPMGIAGCGYEEQLESLYKAIARTMNADEDQEGFIRPDAALVIILVSDEADGSYNRAPYGNFGPYDPSGNKVFWQSPDDPFPTSAVSWNAGVECLGDGLPYDDCYAQHYDIDRNVVSPAQAASQAVFHPVSRYIDQIQAIANLKLVVVAGLLGVPVGYEDGAADVIYRDDPNDPQFVNDFGTGAGCVSQIVVPGLESFQPKAVPPVRQRAFVEHFGGRESIGSICANDFSKIVGIAADLIKHQVDE